MAVEVTFGNLIGKEVKEGKDIGLTFLFSLRKYIDVLDMSWQHLLVTTMS